MFDYKNFHELEQATVAFGQGISVTPLQLVTAICACVNGGYLLQPHILKEISNSSNNEIVEQVKKAMPEEESLYDVAELFKRCARKCRD